MLSHTALRGVIPCLLALGLVGPLPLSAARPKPAQLKPGSPTLKVGDPAPAFTAGRWLKGTPVTAFQPGHVYVVECWATWCGPCREAIPHLTELAKAYAGKITFIGVDVWENGKNPEQKDQKAEAFVQKMGSKMDYNVCRDSKDEHIGNAWLKASGSFGIPQGFVVDARGRIAWMGSPRFMEDVLDDILAGTFDPAIYSTQVTADRKVMEPLWEAQKAKDWKKLLEEVETKKTVLPTSKRSIADWRFTALLHLDGAKALAEFDRRMEAGGKSAEETPYIVLEEEGLSKEWYIRVAEVLKPRSEASPDLSGPEAKARFLGGDSIGAAEAQTRYLAWMVEYVRQTMKDNPGDKQNQKMLEQAIRQERKTLKRYQTGK